MKYKQILATALSAVLVIGQAACSAQPKTLKEKSADQNQVELTFGIWDKRQKPAMEEMASVYEKANPHVKIKVQLTPYKEYWTKLEAAAAGGTAPDIFWLNVLHLDSYLAGGVLQDITSEFKASDFADNYAKPLIDNYVRDAKHYAVPKDFDTNALWYNKSLFDQAKVAYPTDDMTYADLVKLCKELKDKLPKGVFPFACPVDFQTWYYQTVYANGGYIINQDKTETGYLEPKTQAGIQCWIDLIKAGLSPKAATLSETSSDAMFGSQQIAMTFAGSYMLPEYKGNEVIKDKIDCVEIPKFNGTEANCINGLGYAVYSKGKNVKEATKFAIWLGSKEAMAIQGKSGTVISARNDAQAMFAEASKEYHLQAYLNHIDKAYPLPVCLKAAELYKLESQWLVKAYNGEMSLEEACQKLKPLADKLLKQYE